MKKKYRDDERVKPSKKKKWRVGHEEERDEEIDVDVKMYELVEAALEEDEWEVLDMVMLLTEIIQYVIKEYE